ncbi:hypothetical protein ABGB14_48365 [Nonomuraea sp. B10E15]|uniref:hypothetical protein n=1 Tax=Nonomuraea sp. B10E15 TaxID=3153560 RepID=UPI00325D0C59
MPGDDAQWLDAASAQTLAFVARQLQAERMVLVFTLRDPGPDPSGTDVYVGLPELHLEGHAPRRQCHLAELLPTQGQGGAKESALKVISPLARGRSRSVRPPPEAVAWVKVRYRSTGALRI